MRELSEELSQTELPDVTTDSDVLDPELDVEMDDRPPLVDCASLIDVESCQATMGCTWLVPGCAQRTDPRVLPQAGCFPAAPCESDAQCQSGERCQPRVIDPSWNTDCNACSAERAVCAPPYCGAPEREAELELDTALLPSVSGELRDYSFDASIISNAAATRAAPSGQRYAHALELSHGNQRSTLFYSFPDGLRIPLGPGDDAIILYRERLGFEASSRGLIIRSPEAGPASLLTVADVGGGPWTRAFDEDEAMMQPLRVLRQEAEHCPTRVDQDCEGTIFSDSLLFDGSTGAMNVSVELFQGETAQLSVMGQDFEMLNLGSTRVEPTCPDDLAGSLSYLALKRVGDCRDWEDKGDCEYAGCHWWAPATCPEYEFQALQEAGCYPPTDCVSSADCLDGEGCHLVEVDPCLDDDCDACSSQRRLCLRTCWSDENCGDKRCELENLCFPPDDCQDGCEPVCYGLCVSR
ncbi:MAG: hypothetical protein RBU37_12455 [Myxococcota bacterium]|nr:hypothetical protein [Myxococcota bacterium]